MFQYRPEVGRAAIRQERAGGVALHLPITPTVPPITPALHQGAARAGGGFPLISGFGRRHAAYPAVMRIISGKAGGIPIAVPRSLLRPTADRVREAVFSILGARVEGAAVLDLFAGSGSYGLECLSRGARSAVFVESDRGGAAVIAQNLTKARLAGGSVAGASVESWLKRAAGAFDLVFADPPYEKKPGDRDWNTLLLESAPLRALMAPGGLLVLETFFKSAPKPAADSPWQTADERRYGDSALVFLQLQSPDAPAPDPAAL